MASESGSLPVTVVETGSAHDDPDRPSPGSRSASPAAAIARWCSTSARCGGSTSSATWPGSIGSPRSREDRSRRACSASSGPRSRSTRAGSPRLRAGGRGARAGAGQQDHRPGRDPGRPLPARQHLRPRHRRLRQAPVRRTRRSRTSPTGRASSSTPPTCRRAPSSASRVRTSPTTAWARFRIRRVPLAVAVAASSAFPPGAVAVSSSSSIPPSWAPASGRAEDLHREPFHTDVVLTDGGVYDNLGLETAWKRYRTILVSNGGGKMAAAGGAARGLGAPRACASTTSSTTRSAACASGR